MNSPAEPLDLLSDLERRGVRVWHVNGRLRYSGPPEVVKAVLPILRAQREALLSMLRPTLDQHELPVGACPACGSGYYYSDDGRTWTCGRCAPPTHHPRKTLTVPRQGFRVVEANDGDA